MYKHNGFIADPVDTKIQLALCTLILGSIHTCSEPQVCNKYKPSKYLLDRLFVLFAQLTPEKKNLHLFGRHITVQLFQVFPSYDIYKINAFIRNRCQVSSIGMASVFLIANLGIFADSSHVC